MTDRVPGRHRAPHRASTPLTVISTGVTQAIGDHAEALGRGGAALAVSSGLVASLAALPATAAAPAGQTNPQTTNQSQAVSQAVLGTAAVTSPHSAQVVFDRGSLQPATSRAAAREAAKTQALALAAAAAAPRPVRQVAAQSLSTPHVTQVKKAAAVKKATRTTASTKRVVKKSVVKKSVVKKTTTAKPSSVHVAQGANSAAVLSVAKRYLGIYYRYGGTTPRGFDCSGFTQYVYRQVGISLPRVADAQMRATRPISASQARAGDLVFFVSSGRAHHMGIVVGKGMMIDSPRTGKAISVRKIYSSRVVYRRVTG